MKQLFAPLLHCTAWRKSWREDIVAGIVVGIVVIPQSLGYALLAGLPPVYGLYASIVPVLVYALIGSSNTQAIGPIAITAIMTAQAIAPFAQSHSNLYIALAALMALLVGAILVIAAQLKLGWIMQFISRSVMSAFITGAALLIMAGQLTHILGIHIQGETLLHFLWQLWQQRMAINGDTLIMGSVAIVLLWLNRHYGAKCFQHCGLSHYMANLVEKLMPIVVIVVASLAIYHWPLLQHSIKIIGNIPSGLPSVSLPYWPTWQQGQQLLSSALLIALIAFISSASIAKSVALQRQETFDSNKELLGLGLANISAAFFKGFPIAGGFSRTAVNLEAGAKTALAGVFSALTIAVVLLFFATWFYYLPLAVLGAGVIVAATNLVDIRIFNSAWHSDKSEAWAYIVTLASIFVLGLQFGLLLGLLFSMATLVWRSHHPHMAVVGKLGQQEQFKNIARHQVSTWPSLLLLRIDENLFFGNSESIANRVWQEVNIRPLLKNVVLIFSAVNHVDLSSQLMLQNLAKQLAQRGIILHLADIKGFVMDSLGHTELISQWQGQIFSTTQAAIKALNPSTNDIEYHL